jgi:predicted CXXCH cytochrome family protein
VIQKLLLLAAAFVVGGTVLAFGGVGVSLALENQDAFCASCHTEPEVTYYRQSTQANPATLAAFHTQKQTACIDCHSGGGVLGRSLGLAQGAQDLMSYLSGDYHRPAITTNPLGDDSCTKCHSNIFSRANRRGGGESRNGHYHYFLARWQAADPNHAAHCTTCHTAHTTGLDGLQFMNQGKVAQVCDRCHTALGGRIR